MIIQTKDLTINTDSEAVILNISDREKLLVMNMNIEHNRLCLFPNTMGEDEVVSFMNHKMDELKQKPCPSCIELLKKEYFAPETEEIWEPLTDEGPVLD